MTDKAQIKFWVGTNENQYKRVTWHLSTLKPRPNINESFLPSDLSPGHWLEYFKDSSLLIYFIYTYYEISKIKYSEVGYHAPDNATHW